MTRVVILRHAAELRRPSNTARAAALALANAALFDQHPEGAPLPALSGAAVLWPEGAPLAGVRSRPRVLVVLDGSWTQARRMLHRAPELRGLPAVALDVPGTRTPLREGPSATSLSTIEAIAHALAALGEAAPARALLELHARLIAAQRPAGSTR